jgi:hypothetical protein
MVEYIKQYAKLICQSADERSGLHRTMHSPPLSEVVIDAMTGLKELVKEINRLDPRDFEPASQTEFLRVRGNMGHIAAQSSYTKPKILEAINPLLLVLDKFRGAGSSGVTRSFPYLTKSDLSSIVERDYIELNVRLFPSGAWKSTVIMAGSILETLLFDVLSAPKRVAATNASPKAAKARGGVPIDITSDPASWKLSHLIEVASDTNVLPWARADTIDQVLRDYRNFVHPQVELKSQHECNEAEAGLAKYGLDGVCDHFDKTL